MSKTNKQELIAQIQRQFNTISLGIAEGLVVPPLNWRNQLYNELELRLPLEKNKKEQLKSLTVVLADIVNRVKIARTYHYYHKNPISLYQSFHGNPPSRVRKVNLPVPKKNDRLLAIGRLVSAVYEPYGASQRKRTLYEHKFGDDGSRIYPEKPILCTDSKGKHLYIVPDKARPYFTEIGIIK